jgi:ATP-binding cassette subfamily B multidrug efflux pump
MTEDRLHIKYPRDRKDDISIDFQMMRRLAKYVEPYRWMTILAIILLFIAKCIEAAVPIYIGYITQEMLLSTVSDDFQKHILLDKLLTGCLWIIGFLIFGYVLETINVILKNWVSQKAIYALRSDVYQHIENLPLKYFDHHSIGRLVTNTIYDVEQINQMFAESIIPLLGGILLFICMCVGITIIDWRVAIVFALIVPIVGWFVSYFRYNERYWHGIVRSIISVMNAFVQEHLMGASTIRTFGLQKQEKHIFDEVNEDHRKANMETVHHFAFFIAGIDFLQSMSLILVFVVLTLFAVPGSNFQVGVFFTFSLYTVMFYRPLIELADRYNILQSAMSAAERIFHILDQPIESVDDPYGPVLDEIQSISFEDVWFAYEDDHWIFQGLSFDIKKGESIALVGPTGAGKTSVISLLLRFYEFQKGSIKVNGRDIREYPLHVLRQHISVVLQDPVIFSGTIRDNVGLYQKAITDERIHEAIDYVDLHLFVERFPDGLNHHISERGQSLSAGERQLLSLARAVAHNRSMFVLDEATANIDVVTEHAIQDALHKLLKDRTSLVIAHRLSTIRNVTRIILLHKGKVEESGSHDELLQRKGLYEKLYRIQFIAKGKI